MRNNLILEKLYLKVNAREMFLFARRAMTLAEVLITIGIIGVVAAIVIPAVISNMDDAKYKSAYKQAYSDASQVWRQAIANNEMEPVGGWYGGDYDLYVRNYNAFASYFKKTRACTSVEQGPLCWAVNSNDLEYGSLCRSNTASSHSFIDAKGRSWVFISYGTVENLDGLCVDVNGLAKPNIFGKDRFFFASVIASCGISSVYTTDPSSIGYGSYDRNCFVGLQERLIPLNKDVQNAITGSYCPSGKCYYLKWLQS